MKETTLCYIEKDNKFLMLHRIKKAHDPNEGKWIGVGGHVEPGETVDECLLREVMEETGLTLTTWKKRAYIEFISDEWEDEIMHLYTADGFTGDLIECNEGELAWIPKGEVMALRLWEGDKLFLKLLTEDAPYFEMRLEYHGEELVKNTYRFV